MSKYDKLVSLSAQVIRQDSVKGHLRWKVTELARTSGVARSRIYELLGTNKKQILVTALKIVLDDLYGRSPERQEFNRKHGKFAGVLKSRKTVLATPELLTFSYRNRHRTDEIGKLLRNAEQDYMDLLSAQTGVKDKRKLLFMRTMIHGISQAPFITDEEVKILLEDVAKYPEL